MTTLRAAALAALLAGAPALALAADPCAEDAQRLCPDVRSGGGRVSRCLREKLDQVSPACREKLDADALRARRIVETFGRACRADMEAFCRGVEPGRGRILGCLSQHQHELSTACELELTKIRDARTRVETIRESCGEEVRTLCEGVPPQAGPLLECLQANEAKLSPACSAGELRKAAEAASVVDAVEDITRQDRVREALQILQGADAVAFSRSQVLLQFDSYEGLGGRANANRILFNPQFVFGPRRQYSFQLKVPVKTIYPTVAGAPTLSGLGETTAALTWNAGAWKRTRHFLSLGVVADTAPEAPLGAPWAVQPAYAVAGGLARWLSLTTQVVWLRSVGDTGSRPEVNQLLLEPIVVANLPGRSFLTLDTKLLWNLEDGGFAPVMKGIAGIFTDRQKSLSISAWYQAALTDEGAERTFDRAVGLGLAYFFDW